MTHRRTAQRINKKAETLHQAINRQIWRLVAMKEILDSVPQPVEKQTKPSMVCCFIFHPGSCPCGPISNVTLGRGAPRCAEKGV